MSDREERFDDFDEFIGEFNADEHNAIINMISFAEMASICQRHIDNDNSPYTDKEFTKIMSWVQETCLNQTLLNLVLKGKIDVVFDLEKMERVLGKKEADELSILGKDLLFTMTKWTRDELGLPDDPSEPFDKEKLNDFLGIDVDFGGDDD